LTSPAVVEDATLAAGVVDRRIWSTHQQGLALELARVTTT